MQCKLGRFSTFPTIQLAGQVLIQEGSHQSPTPMTDLELRPVNDRHEIMRTLLPFFIISLRLTVKLTWCEKP